MQHPWLRGCCNSYNWERSHGLGGRPQAGNACCGARLKDDCSYRSLPRWLRDGRSVRRPRPRRPGVSDPQPRGSPTPASPNSTSRSHGGVGARFALGSRRADPRQAETSRVLYYRVSRLTRPGRTARESELLDGGAVYLGRRPWRVRCHVVALRNYRRRDEVLVEVVNPLDSATV